MLNEEAIRRILGHVGLWLVKRIPQPRIEYPGLIACGFIGDENHG
jgi:hypothetical protein